MPTSLELPDNVKKVEGRWLRNCPKCDRVVSYLRRNYCIHSHLTEQSCKACSNKNNNPSGMCGYVRVAWLNVFYKNAITRGYEWAITPEDVNSVYLQQNKKCALSGLDIGWSETNWEHSASIDRIDNAKGYTKDNIQLVHKKINMMRGSLSVKEFVEFCRAVASNQEW